MRVAHDRQIDFNRGSDMTTTGNTSSSTGLLPDDPYNDVLSEGGKISPLVKKTADLTAEGLIAALAHSREEPTSQTSTVRRRNHE